MRGTRYWYGTDKAERRIIPADAGNTRHSWAILTIRPGSSPRMRGTPKADAPNLYPTGIIPADAGNTNPEIYVSDSA